MRELKFRCWNQIGSTDGDPKYQLKAEMLYSDSFHLNTSGKFVDPANEYPELYENGIVMQYTGLKDKNGVEIYEGDVFKYSMPNLDPEEGETEYIEEVNFLQGSFDLDGCPVYVANEIGEVIGNIYQNPELL